MKRLSALILGLILLLSAACAAKDEAQQTEVPAVREETVLNTAAPASEPIVGGLTEEPGRVLPDADMDEPGKETASEPEYDPDRDKEIVFRDDALKNAIRRKLGINDTLRYGDIEGIEALDLSRCSLTDISDLALFTRLCRPDHPHRVPSP